MWRVEKKWTVFKIDWKKIDFLSGTIAMVCWLVRLGCCRIIRVSDAYIQWHGHSTAASHSGGRIRDCCCCLRVSSSHSMLQSSLLKRKFWNEIQLKLLIYFCKIFIKKCTIKYINAIFNMWLDYSPCVLGHNENEAKATQALTAVCVTMNSLSQNEVRVHIATSFHIHLTCLAIELYYKHASCVCVCACVRPLCVRLKRDRMRIGMPKLWKKLKILQSVVFVSLNRKGCIAERFFISHVAITPIQFNLSFKLKYTIKLKLK